MSDELIVDGVGKRRFTTIDETGNQRVYDLDKPDREMLQRLCEVASRRVDATDGMLTMLYIDNDGVPEPALQIKDIFRALIAKEITPDQAKQQILTLRESFKE